MCGGFDWDDSAYERAYAELEAALFGEGHKYGAIAPLIGITTGGATIELGGGMRVRLAATGELAKLWPEANGLLPTDFGHEADRLSILELERSLEPGATEPPDAPGEFADAITAIRLATAAPIAAGPVLFERLDWRPYGVRPVLPIAATQPAGEPTRLDSFRAGLAADLLPRLALADDDPELGEALDRWELSLFQDGPFQTRTTQRVTCRLARRQRRPLGRRGPGSDPAGRHAARTRRTTGPTRRRSRSRCHPARLGRDADARRPRTARRLSRRIDPRPSCSPAELLRGPRSCGLISEQRIHLGERRSGAKGRHSQSLRRPSSGA